MAQSDHHDRSLPPGYAFAAMVLLLIGIGLGVGGYRLIAASRDQAGFREIPASNNLPNIVRDGAKITVPEGSPLRSKLEIATVADKAIQRTLVLPAVVEADPARLAKVLPPLSGRITRLTVQLGQRVEVDQPLAVLESSDLRTAYADYDRAKISLALAGKTRDRVRMLGRTSAVAEKEVQHAEAEYATAEAELQRAEARLRQIGVPLDSKDSSRVLTIVSPIAGSVIELGVAPGAFWNDPTAPLMTIADLTTIWVTAVVPEKDISFISEYQSVDVNFPAYPGQSFKGHVLFISDVLDADTRRAKVRVAFSNPDYRLKLGMFANVTILAPAQTLPVVPTAALVLKKDTNRVFVETTSWTFEPRQVKAGAQQGDHIVIQEGLKAGELVVVKGAVLLND